MLQFKKYVVNVDIFVGDFFGKCSVILFFLELFLTLLTMHCIKGNFHMHNHINPVRNVMFVETISRWNDTSENICKKYTFFFIPSWRFQHFWHNLQNLKLNLMTSFQVITCLLQLDLYLPNRAVVPNGHPFFPPVEYKIFICAAKGLIL